MELKDNKWEEALAALNHLFKTDLAFREGILAAISLDHGEDVKVSSDFMLKKDPPSLEEVFVKKVDNLGHTEEVQRGITILEQFISSCNVKMDALATYSSVLGSATKTFTELMEREPDNAAEAGLLTIIKQFLQYDADLRSKEELKDQSLEEVMKLLEAQIHTLTRAAGEQLEEMRNGNIPLVDSSVINALGQEFGVLYSIIQGRNDEVKENPMHNNADGIYDQNQKNDTEVVNTERKDETQHNIINGRMNFIVDVNSITDIKPPETPALPNSNISKGRE